MIGIQPDTLKRQYKKSWDLVINRDVSGVRTSRNIILTNQALGF
jgi:hypothetical protein